MQDAGNQNQEYNNEDQIEDIDSDAEDFDY